MCGIVGILRTDKAPVPRQTLEAMTAAVAHRGPDGQGMMIRDPVGFGHRRLAIIDLQTGQQPMSNEDGMIRVTYNGEIYNYRELTEMLKAKGHKFATRSDTEVIVHAYEEWGPACVEKFRGMFAFALVDYRRQQLLLARDHFGIKPLYYRLGAGYVAFASELAPLQLTGGDAPAGNLRAVDLYLRFQYIPTPHTIYKDVFKLPPACRMVFGFDGRMSGPERYWEVRFSPRDGISKEQWPERTEGVIRESVSAHLVADVPFGVFLSGGTDSTLVALQMSRILQGPVKAFSIGFHEQEYSELQYARAAARRCGVELYTEVISGNVLDMMPDLVAHYGEPFGDSSALATWYVARLARPQVPMVLSGDGGDEAFGGYDSYARWMETAPPTGVVRQLVSASGTALRPGAGRGRRLPQKGRLPELGEWQKCIVYMNDESRRMLWRPEYGELVDQPCELFEGAARRAPTEDWLAYAQYMDYQTYLPCDILVKVDVASMFHGLEVRTPLVDLRVVELAASLPVRQRSRGTLLSRRIGKYVLKQILAKDFPRSFITRRKGGFAIPRAVWFQPGQPGRRLLEDVLLDPKSRLCNWFNKDTIHGHIAAHQGRWDNSGVLWLLFVLGLWLNQNSDVSFA